MKGSIIITPIWLSHLLLLLFCACQSKDGHNQHISTELPQEVNSIPIHKKQQMIFFGNSLTAGYGVESDESYPALIQARLDSMQLDWQVVNAGISGETTADGLRRIDWILQQPMDLFFLELGANDMLRGQSVDATYNNLARIIESVQSKYPDIPIILAGMKGAPNLGADYVESFESIYPRLAQNYDVYLMPFFLEGVAGQPTYNQHDGIHPNPAGHKVLEKAVWAFISPIIGQ